MGSPKETALKLIALAVNEGATDAEQRSAALQAVRIIDKYKLLAPTPEKTVPLQDIIREWKTAVESPHARGRTRSVRAEPVQKKNKFFTVECKRCEETSSTYVCTIEDKLGLENVETFPKRYVGYTVETGEGKRRVAINYEYALYTGIVEGYIGRVEHAGE